MKRKLLSILLTFCLAFSLLPTAALADEGEASGKVAEVDKIEYATLQEAINAAKSGSTVHLLDNVTLTEPAVFPAGKKVDLNLMGHNITAEGKALRINGTTDIQDTKKSGTIESKSDAAVAVSNNAKLTVYSGTLKGREGAVITGTSTGATIEIRYKATLIATDNAVIAGNGSQRDGKPNTILVKGSTFIGGIQSKGYIACGIYAPWNDNVTVSGGTFNITNGAGIVARAGTVKVTGGTFNCTGTAEGYVGDSKNKVPCAALVFDKAANYPALTADSKILVSGGSFSTDPAVNGATLADGYVANRDENGMYKVAKANPVAEINGVKYDTLQAAINAAQATKGGATITLLKNINTESYYTVNGDNPVTIDLAGYNITGSGISGLFYVTAKGDLTIKGEGTVTAVEDNGAAMAVWVHSPIAKVTLEGGTYTQKISNTTDPQFDLIYVERGNVYVKGGTYKGFTPDWTLNCKDEHYQSKEANIEVTGGTFVGFDPANNKAEGVNTSFLPEGYTSTKNDDGTYTAKKVTYVARIGETRYETLTAAIENAEAGETVTLLKDVTGTSTLSVNKTVTIDLNGHTITGEDTRAIHVKGGTLTLTGTGVVTSKKTKSFDGDSSVIRVGDNSGENRPAGLVVGENVTIKAPDSYGITVFGSKTTETVTIKGKVLADHAAAIGGNGSAGFGGTKIVIEPSAEVVSTGYTGIYHPQTGTLTINGGIIKGLSAIESKSGETIIAVNGDPTITATGSISHNENNNGTSTSGYAIAVVNNKNYAGSANVTINSGKYTGLIAVVDDQEDSEKNGTITITGGLFSSDPSAYVADGHYVDASNNGDYPYTVKVGTKPAGALIVVKDKTDAAVNEGIKTEDKKAIHDVIGDANIDGVAEAVTPAKKADIVMKSGVTLTGSEKVEIEIAVKVEAKDADLVNGKLTFEVTPEATVKVDGTEQSKKVPVTNDMLNGKPITVKLPLPTVNGSRFTPKQILHKFTGGGYEYFINESVGGMRDAGRFKIEDNCAVFTIYGFSTFELSGTVTYVEPSYSSGSSYDPTYSVTVDKTKNGTVTVSPKSASKGDTVTVTVKPDSGYVLETLTVTDKNGNELTLKDKGNGKYTFTMPAGKVEVKATFMEDNSMLNFFYDVPNNAYFYEAVKWAVENGITTGVGNDLFAPEQPCTRAQIVTFLWRAAGSPEPKAASSFADVAAGSYYAKAVAWAVENGITTGTGDGKFSPDATCTRAQAVTFLARALNAKASGKAEFSDVPADSYFADAVAWAAANGVTEGIGGGLFGPDNDCTRGQIVTFLYRAYNK